jgi:flagellar hook protein FlgE
MSIFGSMITAVTGLRGQSFALENISDNIANSQTTGYKRVDTTFQDMVPDFPLNQQIGGSVMASSKGTNTITGSYSATNIGTNVALNGQGFFVVRDRADSSGANPVFTNRDLFTRRGDFELDKNGYLVNGAGRYLVGSPVDPITGAVSGGAADVLKINTAQVPAKASTTIEYRTNIPSYPKTANADPAVAGSELLKATGFAVDPRTATGTVQAGEETSFLNQTISGGTVTLYDGLGSPVNVQLRWGKTASASGGGTDTWQLFYMSNPNATGTAVKWTNAGQTFTFNSSGAMTAPTGSPSIANLTVGGTNLGNIQLDLGLTQFAAVSGQVQTSALRQDGYPAGDLDSISVSSDGRVVAAYSNGQTTSLAQISVAQFNAANMLKRMDGSTFSETLESGQPLYGMNGSSVLSGQLESSIPDIAEEFSKLIVTQQAYSANTRVVTTAQQMLQDTINIIR